MFFNIRFVLCWLRLCARGWLRARCVALRARVVRVAAQCAHSKISKKSCHFWLRIRNRFTARISNNMLEHIVTEIIMLRTVTNRGSSAVPTAPRVALRARQPTPRDLIAVHCAGAARLARRRRALDRTSSGSGLSPPASRARPRYGAGRAAPWRHLAAIALAHRSCLQDCLEDLPLDCQ